MESLVTASVLFVFGLFTVSLLASLNAPRRKVVVLIALILADGVTKVLAFLLLPPRQPVRLDALFQVVLALNYEGMGTWARGLAEHGSPWTVPRAVVLAVVACAVLVVHRLRRPTAFSIAACLAIGMLTSGLAALLEPHLPPFGHRDTVVLMHAGQALVWLSLWSISTAGIWMYACSVMAAGAVGNALSYGYPPYVVVDFLYSSAMTRAFGLGVFNLADVFGLGGPALLAVGLLRWIVQRLASAFSRRPPAAADPGR